MSGAPLPGLGQAWQQQPVQQLVDYYEGTAPAPGGGNAESASPSIDVAFNPDAW